MKAISATPVSIQDLYRGKQYIIPPFQRPYTWDESVCVKLWEDLCDFYDKWSASEHAQEEKYFLGTIVVYPEKCTAPSGSDVTECLGVIDGQQRLTTLTLLLSAFAFHNKGYGRLNKIIRVTDSNDDPTSELRLLTKVLEDDYQALEKIVLAPDQGKLVRERISKKDCSRLNNFIFFRDRINDWYAGHNVDADKLTRFIEMLLKNVVILPIHCDSIDDAFLIFEVVNNRGKPLAEADIFKSNILQELGSGAGGKLNVDQQTFLDLWKKWCDSGVEDFLFRALMRIKNGQSGNIDTTDVAIRDYFQKKHPELFKDTKTLIADLVKIYAISQWKRPAEINVLWTILEYYPNEAWKWPLYCYLYAYGNFDQSGAFSLDEAHEVEFIEKCKTYVRYFFAKSLVGHGSLNNLKGTSYKECARIFNAQDTRFAVEMALTKDESDILSVWLANLQKESCYRAGFKLGGGIVLLCSYLMHENSLALYSQFIDGGKVDIEHICPKVWSNVDGWTKEEHEELLNTIGNLIPLEKSINIQVSNNCFEKKKTGDSLNLRHIKPYSKSLSPEARELSQLPQNTWLPADVLNRSNRKAELLKTFFAV